MKCRVAVFLIIGWGVLSLIGYLKKDGIYKNYSIDVKKTPYFVLVLDGIHDKIYPWSKELPDLLPDGTKPQNPESVIASTETLYLLQAMVIRHIRAFLFTLEIHTL